MFNIFDTLFILRTVEHLETAINRRLHLFIIGKFFTTELFFQVWKEKKNTRRWLFFRFEDNQWKLSHMHPKKLMPWLSQQIKLSSPPLEPILPCQSTVLTVPSFQMWSDSSMFHPCLWIDVKNWLYSCTTAPNTQYHFVNFLHHFYHGHLIWSITAMFVLGARTTSLKLCHPILYCWKRRSRLPQSRI